MEKNTDECNLHKSKKIITLTTLIGVILIPLILGLWICITQSNPVYTVKYIHDNTNFIVQTYNKGDKISFPKQPTKSGYCFIGWALDKNTNEVLTHEIYVDKELTLYAQWKEQVYNLKYNNQDIYLTHNHNFLLSSDKLMIVGLETSIEISNPNILGKRFLGWEISDGENNFSIANFSFDNVSKTSLTLIPRFEDIIFSFNIPNSSDYVVSNLSHNNQIPQNETLEFTLSLNESVNKSIPNIIATSGRVQTNLVGNNYIVTISNFTENFNISIDNISINTYSITFKNNDEIFIKEVSHGDTLPLVNFNMPGHTLIGYVDEYNITYDSNSIVRKDLILTAIWEKKLYSITFPKSNGMYAIQLVRDTLSTNKIIYREYNQSIEFYITLSKAYNQSDYIIYGVNDSGKIEPSEIDGNKYVFDNIQSDLEIHIENVKLNSYHISIDGTYYGEVGYGSWIYVEDNNISVRNVSTNMVFDASTLIEDDNFGGWKCNGQLVTTCIVQDIAGDSNIIEIYGDYSKKVSIISLHANGGEVDTTELIVIEGEEFSLPTPTKMGYTFVGWFVKLVEVNTIVNLNESIRFENITEFRMELYAGWTK